MGATSDVHLIGQVSDSHKLDATIDALVFSYGTRCALVLFWEYKQAEGSAAEVKRKFVQIAPAPAFSRLEGAHDGVFGGMKVLCGMLVFG